MPAKKEGFETLGVRLHKEVIHTLKIVAAERKETASDLVSSALAVWWSQQPESKIRGALFPGEPSSNAATATPVATKETPKKATAKDAKKVAQQKKAAPR